MRRGTLRGLINKHVGEAAGNLQQGYVAAADQIEGLMSEGKLRPSDFSFRELFEELVDPERHFDISADPQMIAEAISSSAFPEISNRILHRSLLPEYEANSGMADELVTEENASRTHSEEIHGLTDMESLEMRPEQLAYSETSFGEKDVRIYSADFGRIISLTREAIFDDRTGEIMRRARKVGKKAGQHRTKMIIQTIEMLPRSAMKETATRGFVYQGNAVTQAVFYSTDHSSIDGQTNNNTLTDALGTSGLNKAYILFDDMTDVQGDEVMVDPRILLVPGALRMTSWQLLTSPMQYDTPNRAQNFFGPQGDVRLVPRVSVFLSSDAKYYLGDFKEQLLWLWVWRPGTAAQGADTRLAFENQIVQRYRFNYYGGVGHTDYRYIVRGGS
jgi:hypothetical protein